MQGKTQTHLPWDSWRRPYVDREPAVWFHEVFRNDGTPYRAEEVELIRRMTGKTKAAPAGTPGAGAAPPRPSAPPETHRKAA